jgi:malonyl-CoA O-methyltransferase
VGGLLETRSPTLPLQKQLRRAERLGLRMAQRQPSPEMVTALGSLSAVLRRWGRREAALRIEQACANRHAAPVTGDDRAADVATIAAELQAEHDRIRAAFDRDSADEEHFPSTIDPRIYHVQLILDFFGDLAGRRVLDVGCGKGRFARVLKERHPSAEIWGLDISEEMLRRVPPQIHTRQGVMTDLPFDDAWFDGAYATESLEHAVEIEAAVAEMCRVVRPGGRIVVIDKNAEQAGRLETPPWEKWFGRRELERLLARHCRQVSSEYISYWADVAPDGLFLAWKAIR